MNLLENPFYILGATTRDNRKRILELAEEKSLVTDPALCNKAKTELITPSKRISAELAWFPGLSPRNAENVLKMVFSPVSYSLEIIKSKTVFPMFEPHDDETWDEFIGRRKIWEKRKKTNVVSITDGEEQNINLSDIVLLNVESTLLDMKEELTAEEVIYLIYDLSLRFEALLNDYGDITKNINNDRIASGFPQIDEESKVIEEEIQNLRLRYKESIHLALSRLSTKEMINCATNLIEDFTNNGEVNAPTLIFDMVDLYEIEAKGFLEAEGKNIEQVAERLKIAVEDKANEQVINSLVDFLCSVVKNWDMVAQPIQIAYKRKGQTDQQGTEIGSLIRYVAVVDLYNNGWRTKGESLLKIANEVFAEVVNIAERVEEDLDTVEKLAEERKAREAEEGLEKEKWRKEISFSAEIGKIFKSKLSISPYGIVWNDSSIPLEEITRIRWGATVQYLNGIKTHTDYSISVGDSKKTIEIKFIGHEDVYDKFTNCLWRAVGIRLLVEFFEDMKKSKTRRFGSILVADRGVTLTRPHLFSPDEIIFCPWNRVTYSNNDGSFYLEDKSNKATGSASYKDIDNAHILAAAVRIFFNKGGNHISNALGD